ncbi:hypothetical protein ACLOJK_038077 [Asimina triloba]
MQDLQWERPKELKQAVQQMLETVTETVERLALIEDIQRLGVAYHFEQPTDNALSSLHLKKAEHLSKRDLQATSLYFRLLRQHGCYVSPGEIWGPLISSLHEYMKLCYLALYNTANELAYIALKETGRNLLDYLKKLWATRCNTYLVEAQWLYKDYTPTLEYLNNASVAIGSPLVLAHAYAFILQQMTKEDIDGIDKYLKLIALTSLIFRLFDDLSTSEVHSTIILYLFPKDLRKFLIEQNLMDQIFMAVEFP